MHVFPEPREPLAPAPWRDGLEFLVECRHDLLGAGDGRTLHPVVVTSDWEVRLPHDLDAERIAVALGGYSSCLELVGRTVPALRAELPLLARAQRPKLRYSPRRREWYLPDECLVAGCCRNRRLPGSTGEAGRSVAFSSARSASAHLRSASHLAVKHGLPWWQASGALAAVEEWFALELDDPSREAARRVLEPDGLAELWESGLHPGAIVRMADAVPAITEPLPVAFYLGMAYGTVAWSWTAAVLSYRPDPELAGWLVWQDFPDDPRSASLWGRWLAYGLTRQETVRAVEEQLPVELVAQAATRTGWPEPLLARALVAWAERDLRPTAAHLAELARRRLTPAAPSRGALTELLNDVERLFPNTPATISRTELAVMLAILGNRQSVVLALQHGLRSAAELPDQAAGRGIA